MLPSLVPSQLAEREKASLHLTMVEELCRPFVVSLVEAPAIMEHHFEVEDEEEQ